MKDEHKEHLKGYGPMYSLILLVLGGGGVATLSDNIPVTNRQFIEWTEHHSGSLHPGADQAIKDLNDSLLVIRLEQVRQQLKNAYEDKCRATDASALRYIEQEIQRLRQTYFNLTKRSYQALRELMAVFNVRHDIHPSFIAGLW